ncbi:MAG: DUF2089 domain-containing protein [Chloroflexota bacterium]
MESRAHNGGVHTDRSGTAPTQCPACGGGLTITRLQCAACGTAVEGAFGSGRLVHLSEPHASLLELFLRVRGNVKDMERELGLSYPTVRARLEEALAAARPKLGPVSGPAPDATSDAVDAGTRRAAILDELERGEITAKDAAARLRELRVPQAPPRRNTT